MKIVFFGTTDFAVVSLKAILDSKHEVVCVVSNVDTLGGRGRKEIIQSAVSIFAVNNRLRLLKPNTLKGPKFLAKLKSFEADLFVVVAFRMLPEIIWSMPPKGTINVHGSLLPAYRGAAPINWAIIKGEKTTGVSVFQLDHEIDTGKILWQEKLDIDKNDNFGTVYDKLKHLGGKALIMTLDKISSNNYLPIPQDNNLVSHAPKLTRENTQIEFSKNAKDVVNQCRGLDPYPGAWFIWDKKLIKLWKAELCEDKLKTFHWKSDYKTFLHIGCKDNSISIVELQPEGKKRMSIKEYLNGMGNKLKKQNEQDDDNII